MIRSYGEDKMYVINYIKMIEDYNEVTAHLLSIFLGVEMRSKGYLVEEQAP